MTVPFLSTLPRSARLFYPIAQRGVREGLSANRIIEAFRAGGGRIRRQTALEVVRRERGVREVGVRLRFLKRGTFPDIRRLPEALTKLRRAFSFTVRLRGIDAATFEDVERMVTVALDRPQSRSMIEQIAFEFAQPEPEQYGMELTEVLLMSGKKAGLPGTLL